MAPWAGWSAALLAGLVGCGGEAELPPNLGCSSTRECDVGLMCDRPSATCTPEPENGLAGSFDCPVFARKPTSAAEIRTRGVGASELVGSFGGRRLAVLSALVCFFHEWGFFMQAFDSPQDPESPRYMWTMLIQGGSRLEIGTPFSLDGVSNISRSDGIDTLDYEIVAVVKQGTVTLDGAPVAGTNVTGFLRVELEAP